MQDFERKTYYEDDDFRVYLEYFADNLVVHVVIFKASIPTIRRIKEVWSEVMINAWFEGFEDVFAYTKDPRIINIIGGAEKVKQIDDMEVWKWDLRQ